MRPIGLIQVMRSTLKKIIEYKKEELASRRRKVSLKDVQLKADDAPPAWPFLAGFKEGEVNIIAEVKKASPSAGIIRSDFSPVNIAILYEEFGARAISVLTDENFFKGSLDFLTRIKQHVSLPCLRKDFTLDEYHVFEARGAGADAVLLIAAVLDKPQLKDYHKLIEELGMTPLVEVHDEKDLAKVQSIPPKLIGINNRNLHTFETSLDTSLELSSKTPEGATLISESGLKSHQDLVDLTAVGFSGFLIGEALMREEDVGGKLKEFIYGTKVHE